RGAGDADGRMDNRIVARVDMPPEVRDNLMNPKRRTDHQNPRALAWEQRDTRRDYRRPSNTLARVDTSADAPNRGFERESAATDDPGGGGSQDRMGARTGSADDSRSDLAALDRQDIARDQPDAESRAALTKGIDADSVKGGPAGEKTESAIAPPPPGEVVVVRRSWAKIRRAPRENSRAIALVYGNDTFQVVNTDGEWVQVRFGRNNRHKGWLSLSDVSK
ncbi:MAG: hypothetical protein V3S64_11730, partial [bacterium]